MTTALVVEGLWKRYRRGARSSEWALRDVDIAVNPGEVVAVVGRNGAGKSTLLKLVAGVTRPTKGTIARVQRVAPLLELGAGFHSELTGRENVTVNARLLGLTKEELRRRFDEIVEFAELAHVIDQPVREYSSGMFMRLAFAVAVHTAPELLLVDEALAVGDYAFQAKCLSTIRSMCDAGAAVLYVSHSSATVTNFADRALLLERGEVAANGPVRDVLDAYYQLLSEPAAATAPGAATGAVRLDTLVLSHCEGSRTAWYPGELARIVFGVTANAPIEGMIVSIELRSADGSVVASWVGVRNALPPLEPGQAAEVRIELPVHLNEGRYSLTVAATSLSFDTYFFAARCPDEIVVLPEEGSSGLVHLNPTISMQRRGAR